MGCAKHDAPRIGAASFPRTDAPALYFPPRPPRRRWRCRFGTFGSVGVTGISLGGVRAGRLAAWRANASATNELVTGGGNAVVVACLNGLPFTCGLLSLQSLFTRRPPRPDPDLTGTSRRGSQNGGRMPRDRTN